MIMMFRNGGKNMSGLIRNVGNGKLRNSVIIWMMMIWFLWDGFGFSVICIDGFLWEWVLFVFVEFVFCFLVVFVVRGLDGILLMLFFCCFGKVFN